MKLVIFGAGPLALLMDRYFSEDTDYEVVAFCADGDYCTTPYVAGRPLVPFNEIVSWAPPQHHEMFVAVGYRRMRERRRCFERAVAAGYQCANYISPRAIIHERERIGQNNVFMDQVLMEPFARIRDNNLFWSGSFIGHECLVGSHNYLSARVIIGGQSTVGDGCFFGNGACTINAVELSEETMLLPGAFALRSTEPFTKYLGNPARAIGSHEEHGIVIERG